jgi:hypothetical protein
LESLTTDSDGIKATAKTYESGRRLDVLYHQGNALVWYAVTVPKMNEKDAEANTYNDIALEAFAIGTYTSDVLRSGAYSFVDNSVLTIGSNSTNFIMSYELTNSGADNTGLMDSSDPVYDQNLRTCIVITFTGTGYEHVIPNGVDKVFTLGNTLYAVKYYDPQALTKWKVGQNYVSGYEGTDIRSFSLDLSGVVSPDAVTMQITAYAYGDPDYAESHGGSVGNSKVTIAEQTVYIVGA